MASADFRDIGAKQVGIRDLGPLQVAGASGLVSYTLSDTLSLSDVLQTFIDSTIKSFTFTETLSLSDHLDVSYNELRKHLGDNLLLSDAVAALLAENPSYTDQLILSDIAKIQLSLGLPFSDSISLLDSIQVKLSNHLTVSPSDTLNLSDSLVVLLSNALDSYIRHYLNDVP